MAFGVFLTFCFSAFRTFPESPTDQNRGRQPMFRGGMYLRDFWGTRRRNQGMKGQTLKGEFRSDRSYNFNP